MENGEVARLPGIEITWDESLHSVRLETHGLKTPDFILAVLEMARLLAEDLKKQQQLNLMMAHAANQQQAQSIASALPKNLRR